MSYINQYSYLIFAVFLIFILTAIRKQRGWQKFDYFIVSGMVILFFAIWIVVSPEKGDKPLAELPEDRPVFLVFQSPFCLGCINAEPNIKAIENSGLIDVFRVNIQRKDAQTLKDSLSVRFTPTFVLLNQTGDEIWRQVGSINMEEFFIVFEKNDYGE